MHIYFYAKFDKKGFCTNDSARSQLYDKAKKWLVFWHQIYNRTKLWSKGEAVC